MEKFYEKLELGQHYERCVADLLKAFDKSITHCTFNDNSDYDIRDSNGVTYEVKADVKALKTGNFFVEYASHNETRLSGLSVTKANYHVLTDTINYYLISTEKLKSAVKSTFYHKLHDDKDGTVQHRLHGSVQRHQEDCDLSHRL